MLLINKKLDQLLLDLAWSLWTELGVCGVKQKHQKCLINLEELILLTAALAEIDPRLRDESLDWCSQYHHFVSITRLKSIMKGFGSLLNEPFSVYSATLNSNSRTFWPLFSDVLPVKFIPSNKSCLRSLQAPALINLRVRSIFGTGARADLLTFFLTHPKLDFAASDIVVIGYSKRILAEILEEFCLSGLLDKYLLRNQQRYSLIKYDLFIKILGPIPDFVPSWRIILEILLPLRECIIGNENKAESTQVVEIRNFLSNLQQHFQSLNLQPPAMQSNYSAYLNSFKEWIIEIVRKLAEADFSEKFFL